jgi:hypothetical protein
VNGNHLTVPLLPTGEIPTSELLLILVPVHYLVL